MITEEKLKIYEIIIKGFSLTENTLSLYGITTEKISLLIEENFLKEIEPGKYTLVSAQGLYNYGIKLLSTQHTHLANECFRHCRLLEPNNRNMCMQLLIKALKNENYGELYPLFEAIEKIEPLKYQKDNNLYLFLLGQIISSNEEYLKRFKKLTREDILTDQNDEENIIRELIISEKYKRALTFLNDKIATSQYSIEDKLLKELLSQVINRESKLKMKLYYAAKEKRYSSIVYFLESKQKHKQLTEQELIIYLIAKEIISILETKKIKLTTNKHPKNLLEAVETYNFYQAKRINLNFLNRTGKSQEKDLIYILLEDINKLIKEYREEQTKQALLELLNKSKEAPEEQSNSSEIKLPTVIEEPTETNHTKEEPDTSEYIKVEEEIADYIKEMNIPLNMAAKSLGLLREQIALIKLIYARNYYFEGTEESYLLGDKLVEEVEKSFYRTERITTFLEEVKRNRNEYAKSKKTYTKKLVKGDN